MSIYLFALDEYKTCYKNERWLLSTGINFAQMLYSTGEEELLSNVSTALY